MVELASNRYKFVRWYAGLDQVPSVARAKLSKGLGGRACHVNRARVASDAVYESWNVRGFRRITTAMPEQV